MKLARFGPPGEEQPAIVDGEGRLRDASALVADITVASLEELRGVDPDSLPLVEEGVRLGVPFAGTRKILGIGLNYRKHAAEASMPVPSEPIIFLKAITSLAGPNDPVPLPVGSVKMDWEVELGVVIGRTARYVSEGDAMEHVAGYVLVNDISERQDQLERGGSWDKGKGHDGFGPVGPWLVTRDELGEANDLSLTLDVNGIRMQDGTTSDMIFTVPEIVAYASRFMRLEPGDIIATGTPAGVGAGQKPEPLFLKVGDRMRLSIPGLGAQEQQVIANPHG